MHKFPMIPVVATVIKICAVIALVAMIFLGATQTVQTAKKVKAERKQIADIEAEIAKNPMAAYQYGPNIKEQIQLAKGDLKPLMIASRFTQPLLIGFAGIVLLAFLWGVADLFLAVRQIAYNTRKRGELEEDEEQAPAVAEMAKAAVAE